MKKYGHLLLLSIVILILGCEKPIKTERIWGVVVSVNGNRDAHKNPLDCHIVAKFEKENVILSASYRVSYDRFGVADGYWDEYEKCWKSLLLGPGDPVAALKKVWADGDITYELEP